MASSYGTTAQIAYAVSTSEPSFICALFLAPMFQPFEPLKIELNSKSSCRAEWVTY